MEFVTTEGLRSNSKIVHCNNGYFYKIKCTRTNSQSLQCIQTGCSATGLIVENLLYEKRTHTTHGPDMDYLALVTLKHNILRRCVEECTPLRVIYEEETSRTQGLEHRMEYNSLLRTMERTRAAAQPKIPGDLMEYAGHLVDARYVHLFRTANGRSMFRGFVNGPPDVGSAVVFISPSLENLLTSAQEIHIDATFKSRPLVPQTEQLLIIMATYMDQVNFV
ncbi:uncharacterized protein LOC126555201 [Aphis gossypii]|uniref:uncharacterized protein LOC126555201 n=1 Tax=Aphis gossypii TaxID=80765 RepID=UPI002158C642|nr:uncharacterized protein LOC126555201 [Aphis gossypii]